MRTHLVRCCVYIFLSMATSYWQIQPIMQFLQKPLGGIADLQLISVGILDVLTTNIKIACWFGFWVSLPAVLAEIYAFLAPGLYKKEKVRLGYLAVGFFFLLYAGMLVGFYIVLPFIMHSMLALSGHFAKLILSYESYYSLCTSLITIFGFIGNIPLVALSLSMLGWVSYKTLAQYRRILFFLSFVFGGLLAPPDVFSMCLVSVPLYLLAEIGLWSVWIWEKKHSR
jgi:sec-independent protein translocase protein TatC